MKYLLLGVNIVASVVIPLVTNVISPNALSSKEQFFLGLAIFAIATGIECLAYLARVSEKIDRATSQNQARDIIVELRDEDDAHVLEIQRLIRQLHEEANGKTELFYEYHKRKMSSLESSLREACVNRELQVDETMFAVTDWLLRASFAGGADAHFLRAVLRLDDLDFFFGVHARAYFRQMLAHVKAREAAGVKRLIVIDNFSRPFDIRLEKLIVFHNRTSGYECKGILRNDFERIIADYHVQHIAVDFGVYASSYVYKGMSSSNSEIVGSYSSSANEVQKFTSCFESCWQSASSFDHGSQDTARPTIDWLFA